MFSKFPGGGYRHPRGGGGVLEVYMTGGGGLGLGLIHKPEILDPKKYKT